MTISQNTSLLTRRSFTHLSATAVASALGCVVLPGCMSAAEQAPGSSSASQADDSLYRNQEPSSQVSSSTAAPLEQSSQEAAAEIGEFMLLPEDSDGLAGAQFFAFDTICTIKAYADESTLRQLYERCVYFDEHLSRQRQGSDIWNVNAAAGTPVQVAPETANLVLRSLAYCASSDGLFDITIGAATELWDFSEGVIPSQEALAEAVTHINWRCVSVENNTICLSDPAARIDLGGIAKGYIADELAAMLRQAECPGALINLGGNVYALGNKSDGSPWTVGLQDPNNTTGSIFGKLTASDASVVTSGLYERYFEQNGIRYHHILDPRTGYPVQTDLLSSTILSDASIDGDAYATILFLQGSKMAMETLEQTPGLEGLVFSDDGATRSTPAFVWESA